MNPENNPILGYDNDEPIIQPNGMVYTRAFIFCRECNKPISAHGGPRYNAVCVECYVNNPVNNSNNL
jgi:hypothetical protein